MGIKRYPWLTVIIILFCVFIVFTLNAHGLQLPIRLGRTTIAPSLGYQLRYDDNLFYASENQQDDFVNILTPGLLLTYAGARPGNLIQIGYSTDVALHREAADNNWSRHSPFLSFTYASPLGYYVRFGDNYTWSEDPFGSFNEFDQSNRFGLGEKTRRWDNAANLLVGYNVSPRYFIEGTYNNYVIRYDLDKDKWQERTDNIGGLTLGLRVTPRLSLISGYRLTRAVYDKQNDGIFDPGRDTNWSSDTSQDYYIQDISVGVRIETGGPISGEVSIGYEEKSFDNLFDPLNLKYEDSSSYFIRTTTGLTYQPTARSTLTLNTQRAILGSPDADATSFINTLVQVGLNQQLFSYGRIQCSGRLLGGWNFDDYQNENPGTPEKYFQRWNGEVGIDASYRWITLGLSYSYETQVASDPVYATSEYELNRTLFNIALSF